MYVFVRRKQSNRGVVLASTGGKYFIYLFFRILVKLYIRRSDLEMLFLVKGWQYWNKG